MSTLINRKQVRTLALDFAHATRARRFTRVGQSFLHRIETRVRTIVEDEVRRHPSKGRTLA